MLLLQKTGIYSLVQDKGRLGFRAFGISVNGVRDSKAAKLANQLLGNSDDAALIEIMPPNFEAKALLDCHISIVGAVVDVFINGSQSSSNKVLKLKKDDILSLGKTYKGVCVYLAMQGGIKAQQWLGSKSTNLKAKVGGIEGNYLQKGNVIEAEKLYFVENQYNTKQLLSNVHFQYLYKNSIRCLVGNEWEFLTTAAQVAFQNEFFTFTTRSDRMGWRIEGKPLLRKNEKEMRSVAVGYGTIQLLPDGQLIILGPDAQTTGGYPRIAHIISDDLPIIGQAATNQTITFQVLHSL